MLLQCPRALCKSPRGPGRIRKYLGALFRLTCVSRGFACGFRTNSHFPAEVITPICGLPNPIGLVLPMISHIHSCPPDYYPLHHISLSLIHMSTVIEKHTVNECLSISPSHGQELTPSTAYTEHSIDHVQHLLKTVCFPFILTISS